MAMPEDHPAQQHRTAHSVAFAGSTRTGATPLAPPSSEKPEENDNDGDDDDDDGNDDDDYMNFVLPDQNAASAAGTSKSGGAPSGRIKETSLQRAARLRREASLRAHPKSKAELERDEALRREAAMLTRIDQSNRGWKMMAKQGFRQGDVLGPKPEAGLGPHHPEHHDHGRPNDSPPRGLREPIAVDVTQSRQGIGLVNAKKRKFREEAEALLDGERRQQESVDDYRSRQALERESRRCEHLLLKAQKVAMTLAADDGVSDSTKLLAEINVLWRGLVQQQRERDRDLQLRADLFDSASFLQNAATESERPARLDSVLPHARDAGLAKEATSAATGDSGDDSVDDGQTDSELATFQAMAVTDQLAKVVHHLRDEQQYCFWCKTRYPDAAMNGCPGAGEDDHD